MTDDPTPNWTWCWPDAGPTPVNQSSDAEIFDGQRVPLAETVVREAIQNSLDARLQRDGQPVRVRMAFHETRNGPQRYWLSGAIEHRRSAGLTIPDEWDSGIVRWMTVEDFGSTGLEGSPNERTGDFWNYWLNFGLSNKGKSSRGGRGIGRVTFLISSTMNTVLGWTRRSGDLKELACGMTVLKAGQYGEDFRSTHAYLAEAPSGSVYQLHESSEFIHGLCEAFALRSGLTGDSDSGLSLVIPYPHEGLNEDGIKASVVEHFGPAVLDGSLEVTVGNESVNAQTLPVIANECADHFSEQSIRDDPNRYVSLLNFVRSAPPGLTMQLPSTKKDELLSHRDSKEVVAALDTLDDDKPVRIDICFPLKQRGNITESRVQAIIARTPRNCRGIDMFFRDGMYLPDVVARSSHGFDSLMLVDDPALSDYLNLCEGKAHLSLLETREVIEKLTSHGYQVSEKRLVANLPTTLRALFIPDTSRPDRSIFSGFFSVPSDQGPQRKKRPKTNPNPEPPKPEPIPKLVQAFAVTEITSGLRITANEEFTDWPSALRLTLAYADGSRKPKWSPYDFRLEKLSLSSTNCTIHKARGNMLIATDCNTDFTIDITGFDTNRELDARLARVKRKEAPTDA